MSTFKWYRKWRGGCWYYTHFIGWQKVGIVEFKRIKKERGNFDHWSLEDYSSINFSYGEEA